MIKRILFETHQSLPATISKKTLVRHVEIKEGWRVDTEASGLRLTIPELGFCFYPWHTVQRIEGIEDEPVKIVARLPGRPKGAT